MISRKNRNGRKIHDIPQTSANNKLMICGINDKPNLISQKNLWKVENKYI